MDIKNIIVQKIDLPQFIKDYGHVELTRKGNGWRCQCPIHDNSENPEAMFIDDKGTYYCFACNSGGNVINFLSDLEHISYSAATERLASILNINLKDDVEYQNEKAIEEKFEAYKQRGISGRAEAMDYLTSKRGFTVETIEAFELGMSAGKLTIPLLDENSRTVGMAVRRFDGKPKYMNSRNNLIYDKSEFLFGLDKARRLIKSNVYVVEGYMDAISGYQMGLPTVAYCSNELHRDQVRVLNNYLRKDTTVIICPDNDDAGQRRIPRVRDYFKKISPTRQVRVLIMPDGYKDMNDLLLDDVDLSTLPTEHIDKYTMGLKLEDCKTIEEEYQAAEEYLPTVHSEMIRLDIIKDLSDLWKKDVEDLKRYFNTTGEDSSDILKEAADITGCISDLKKIYSIGGFPTHFQQIDNCIRKIEKKQVVVVGAYSGVGKALTLDSKIATPTGFIRMGDIKVGDTVFDEKGKPTKVTHVFPQGEKDVYRVTLVDGTFLDCCEDHLWKFKVEGGDWEVSPLREMSTRGRWVQNSGWRMMKDLYLPICAPVDYPEKVHDIPPYEMGRNLGNKIFFNPEEIWEDIYGEGNVPDDILGRDLFIPEEYIFDSKKNRFELIRGIIDSGGYVNQNGLTGFMHESEELIYGLRLVIESLGARCSVVEHYGCKERFLRILDNSDRWFTKDELKEKWAKLYRYPNKERTGEIKVLSIEKLSYKQSMQCITVDSPSHTYLCDDYIVTHNTDFAIEYMLRAICQENLKVAFFSLEMPKGKLIERCIGKLLECSPSEVEGYLLSDDTTVQNVVSKLQGNLVVFDGNNYSMADIEKRIQLINTKNVLGGPIDMVFVDYFGYMAGTSDFEGASATATRMKAVAKENNLIFVMLSQLNRGGNPYGEPNMQQLKLTGDLEASADVIMLLWRPGKDPNLSLEERDQLEYVTRIKIDKARDGMYGNPVSEYFYNKETSRLEERYVE